MILCSCGNEIEYFLAVAQQERSGRYIIISNGAHFACSKCCDKIQEKWQIHNKNRIEKYLIQTAKVNVKVDTKKEFEKRVLPQIINQFKTITLYVPKTDIKLALSRVIKS